MKKTLYIVVMVVLILFALNFDSTKNIISAIGGAFAPLFLGVFFALLLRSPVTVLERTLLSSPKLERVKRPLSVAIALVVSLGAIALIGYLIVPELSKSLVALKNGLEWLLSGGLSEKLNVDERVENWLNNALSKGADKLDDIIPNLINLVGDTLKGIVNAFLGLMIGVTMLLSGKTNSSLCDKIGSYLMEDKDKEFLKGALNALVEKFSRYLGGSVLEAIIFSAVCYAVFLIFKVPYALLVAVVVGLFNLIPTIGGYVGGGIGALIIFTHSPEKVVVFIIIMLIIQQIEQVTTYPLIVGKYLGLSSFFVLCAVVVGGGLFGFWGFILGVPIFAFIYNLIEVIVSDRAKFRKKEQITP
ncbi:MAG: AI-2E family transporter [Clostridia bacterium]|nr:AI-2E family transporter [Clostridia bacterium]